ISWLISAKRCQVFMGTPHRGSSLADWGSILTGVGKVMFLSPKKEFLDNLKSNNNAFLNSSEDLFKIVDRYSIKSFYKED
ncbi:hypothetical protein B0T18DRAFT_301009, partial [Schizothecium vesticola]